MTDNNKKFSVTQKDIEKIIPPKDKREAIAQSEKYTEEFEKNRDLVNKMFEDLQKMFKEFGNSDEK